MSTQRSTFPSTYADVDTKRLLDAFVEGPARLRFALGGLSEEGLRARPLAGKWSALEIALHVADSELVGAARMRLVLGADEPGLPGYDQDRWSRDLRYAVASSARLQGALHLFSALREATLPLLAAVSADGWSRTGLHPEHGRVTLRNLLELYADHSERHVAQVLERRDLLGSPMQLPEILPERLY